MAFVRVLMVIAVLKVSHVVGSSNGEPKTPLIFELLTPHVEKGQYTLCLNESNLTIDDLTFKGQEQRNQLSEKKLCYIKCMALKAGILTRDGTIIIDKVREISSHTGIFTSSNVDAITGCLSSIKDKILTCTDIKKVIKCFKLPNL